MQLADAAAVSSPTPDPESPPRRGSRSRDLDCANLLAEQSSASAPSPTLTFTAAGGQNRRICAGHARPRRVQLRERPHFATLAADVRTRPIRVRSAFIAAEIGTSPLRDYLRGSIVADDSKQTPRMHCVAGRGLTRWPGLDGSATDLCAQSRRGCRPLTRLAFGCLADEPCVSR